MQNNANFMKVIHKAQIERYFDNQKKSKSKEKEPEWKQQRQKQHKKNWNFGE